LLDKISETVNFIRSNDTAEHAFALTYSVPDYDGRYWLRAYVERHADDLEPGNDTLMAQFSCKRNNIGIARHDGEGWNLGQNEPNPASGVTAIPFNVPSDGRVVLSVMGVNGQLLHREEIDATAGANRVELQLETLPAGLYYYSLEYRGQRQVRKMTVIK
ncbi:MAG: T9SS type A sorting domain-containing protein, partial [Bacteroidales bacterium]|nr:T9SS type A sorting domain-containing protein [Bacteroidales bacterium]